MEVGQSQVMAFNVFKIFVANPEKNEKIVEILLPNLERILKFLKHLGEDDDLEGKFEDDLQVLKEQLDELKLKQSEKPQKLERPVKSAPPATAPATATVEDTQQVQEMKGPVKSSQ